MGTGIPSEVRSRWRVTPGPVPGHRPSGTWAATRDGAELIVTFFDAATFPDREYPTRVAAALRARGWPTRCAAGTRRPSGSPRTTPRTRRAA